MSQHVLVVVSVKFDQRHFFEVRNIVQIQTFYSSLDDLKRRKHIDQLIELASLDRAALSILLKNRTEVVQIFIDLVTLLKFCIEKQD
jgi:hypothetical protein